jgi:hypothetical protein
MGAWDAAQSCGVIHRESVEFHVAVYVPFVSVTLSVLWIGSSHVTHVTPSPPVQLQFPAI